MSDIVLPPPAQHEVRVAVAAVGLNFPDVLMVKGQYQDRPVPPFVPGGELAGRVVATGTDVAGWRAGDEVMALTYRGALAREANVAVGTLRRRPSGMSLVEAAAFQGVFGTATYALEECARVRPGETVLVLGAAGGVGLAAIQVAKAQDARVVAAAAGPDKLAMAHSVGADATIDYSVESLRQCVRDLTAGRGIDVVVDPVGGDAFDAAVRCMAWGGRYLVVGFASGRIGSLPANRALLGGFSLIGVYYGRFREHEPVRAAILSSRIERLYEEGLVRVPVGRVFPLASAVEGLRLLENRRAIGKVVIVMS